MYDESGVFPTPVMDEPTVTPQTDNVYVAEGGELPPPPEDPPKR